MISDVVPTLPQLSWFVVATRPHRELFAEENIVRQSYGAYRHFITKIQRHARRILEARRLLFQGYLFFERQPPLIFRSILGTCGVCSVVRTGDAPALLPSDFITSFNAREVDGVVKQPETTINPGQAVKIDEGPFDSVVDKIIEARE